jgi:hypothetical protein
MRIVIKGHSLPGRRCGEHTNAHVALQVGSRPEGLVPGDALEAEWTTDVRVISHDDGRDFRGPAVHGKRGERFLYLTWGDVDGPAFAMFRRAKLMLDDLPADAEAAVVHVELTAADGTPSCARLRDPAVRWVPA